MNKPKKADVIKFNQIFKESIDNLNIEDLFYNTLKIDNGLTIEEKKILIYNYLGLEKEKSIIKVYPKISSTKLKKIIEKLFRDVTWEIITFKKSIDEELFTQSISSKGLAIYKFKTYIDYLHNINSYPTNLLSAYTILFDILKLSEVQEKEETDFNFNIEKL